MGDQEKFRKMLEMLILISGNLRYTIKHLAKRFEISERTVYRYIDTFKNSGLVIESHEGYINIDKCSSDFKEISDLLHFSEEEAYILSKAIHAIDENNLIKTNLIKKLYSLYDFDRVVKTIVKKEHSESVHQILTAIKSKKQVALVGYQSANSAEISDRVVEPFDFSTNYINVWCFEPASGENKQFKTSRISKVVILDNDWQHKDQHNAGYTDVFRICEPKKTEVKLRLTLRAKNLLEEEYPLSEQFIFQGADSAYYFDGFVCGFEGVGRFILGLCNDTTILEPKELVDFIKNKIEKSTFIFN